MRINDQLCSHYKEILDGVYECTDRFVVNGYFRQCHSPGGFRHWWRQLKGSDDDLDKNHLIRMAGRFSRRVKAFTAHNGIPLIYCKPGERKHELAEGYLPAESNFNGIFLILVSKYPVLIWDVNEVTKHLQKKTPYPYVNNYWFHIMDKDWGHITIRISGHPPFEVQVMLNGHEWVERQAIKKKLALTKEGNCFTSFQNPADLCDIAETLYQKGQLQSVCDRWTYQCLWFGLKPQEQQKSGFYYQYSLYQMELSRNFLFHRGTKLDELYQSIIDRTRSQLDIKKLKTIFGLKVRPYNRMHKKTSFQIRIERPMYNMTIFKIHEGRITVKMYDKGERVLRIEVVCHNISAMHWRRGLDNFSMIGHNLRQRLDSFISVLFFAHVSFINKGELDQLSEPTQKGKKRLAGINLNKPRCRNVMKAVLELCTKHDGFTSKEVANKYLQISGISQQNYNPRQASYDLRKLKAKGLLKREKDSRKYRITAKGVAITAATIVIREKMFEPILEGVKKKKLAEAPRNLSKIDLIYISLRDNILDICNEYGVKGVIM